MKKTLTVVITVLLILLAGVIAAHAQLLPAAGKALQQQAPCITVHRLPGTVSYTEK